MIKAVFFDIDGTLVSFRTHAVPASAAAALKELKDSGVLLFVATGRAKDGLGVLEGIPFDGYITLNGQYCFDGEGNVVYENTIAREDLLILQAELEKRPFPCGYVLDGEKIFNFRDHRVDEVHEITKNDAHPAGDTSGIADRKVYQIMAFLDEEEEKEIVGRMPHCTSARWYHTFCDISPLGGTKVKGIDVFCERFGITREETMAVGDGGNDLPMLEHAGIAVAMGNADEQVKKAADYVTDDTDHDGIRKAFIHFGMIRE